MALDKTKRTYTNRIEGSRNLSENAFHEKAGRSQGDSGFIVSFCSLSQRKVFLPPSSHCRHASIRTLEERIVSLGACGAFSIQPVLPSVWRPVVLLFESGTRPRRLTQSPELSFGFCLFSSWNDFAFAVWFCRFVFMPLPPPLLRCCCATVRTLRRSPTSDAAVPPAFLPWRRWLASSRFFHHAPPASVPSA